MNTELGFPGEADTEGGLGTMKTNNSNIPMFRLVCARSIHYIESRWYCHGDGSRYCDRPYKYKSNLDGL